MEQPVKAYLLQPRNPGSAKAAERRWSLRLVLPGHGEEHGLPGTRSDDPGGAQRAADALLEREPAWERLANGNYRADIEERAS